MKTRRKNTIQYLRNGILILSLILINLNLNAQSIWDSAQYKTKSNTFKCKKLSENKIYVENTRYEPNLKDRKHYDSEKNEFSYVKIKSHDDYLKAFKESFSDKRISKLSSLGERIIISFLIDESGNIILVNFSLDKSSNLSIEELEILENQLINNVKFDIVGKKILDPIFYNWGIRIFFREVEKGEIEFARKSENFKGY